MLVTTVVIEFDSWSSCEPTSCGVDSNSVTGGSMLSAVVIWDSRDGWTELA